MFILCKKVYKNPIQTTLLGCLVLSKRVDMEKVGVHSSIKSTEKLQLKRNVYELKFLGPLAIQDQDGTTK
jgi:hypothetical protein